MRKETGKLIIQYYDEYGHKVSEEDEDDSFISSKDKVLAWENNRPGNNAVVMRVMYNTHSNNQKWKYIEK